MSRRRSFSTLRDHRSFLQSRRLQLETLEDRRLLVADPTALHPSVGFQSISQMVYADGALFFVAKTATEGNELWVTNGQTLGVVDVNPGSGDSNPTNLVVVDNTVFFTATSPSSGKELWKAGTSTAARVKDINPGTANSNPSHLVNVNGTLYFSASDGANGQELWKSNGTEAGTVMVADTAPGTNPLGPQSGQPRYLTNYNGTLVFNGPGNGGRALWRSDGTTTGTGDFWVASSGSDATHLFVANGQLFFRGSEANYGQELWLSNGTWATSRVVKDINPGSASSWGGNLGPFAAKLDDEFIIFQTDSGSDQGLWKTSGHTVDTTLLKPGLNSSVYWGSPTVGNTLFFPANDGVNGRELWKTDGTAAGTVMVKDLNPGGAGAGVSMQMAAIDGTVFFRATDGSSGYELWKTDGTAEGTTLVKDLLPGGGASYPSGFLNVGGELFFIASDSTGPHLWRYQPNRDPFVTSPVRRTASEAAASFAVNLLENAEDRDNDPLSISGLQVTSGNADGITINGSSLTVNPLAYRYLAEGQTEVIEYSYLILDGQGGSVSQTAEITIQGLNNAPVVAANLTATTNEDASPFSGNLLQSVSDPDNGATLSVANLLRIQGNISGITFNGSTITVNPAAYNFLRPGQSEVIKYSYDVVDEHGASAARTITVTIDGRNDSPTSISLSNGSVTENQSLGTSVGLLSATDPDTGDVFVHTLVDGAGSTDNASFEIVGNQLQTKAAFDFETKQSYSIRVRSTDNGGLLTEATFTIDVVDGNDAPVLNTGVAVNLDPVAEDTLAASNPGTLVSDLLDGITDVDAGALKGIAVSGANNIAGIWQYTLDGTNWVNFGAVSRSEVRLLAADATTRVRLIPKANYNGTASLWFFAWDRTSGAGGGTANLTTAGTTGGTTAFSTVARQAFLSITPVNDAPKLNTGVAVALDPIAEDSTPPGTLVSSLLGGITDVDAGALKGIAVSSANSTAGTWQYTLDGTNWLNVGAVSRGAVRLLPADATTRVRLLPKANFNGTASIWFFAWDQSSGSPGGTANLTPAGTTGGTTAFSTAVRQTFLSVTPVNDAPKLNTVVAVNLNPIAEDSSPAGTLVSALIGGITDVDAGALKGIAVSSANNAAGTWQYALDGTTWQNFGAVSKGAVRLLAADATTRVRLLPNANYNGTTSLWFFAWDRTNGTPGGTANLIPAGTTGGTTAFSTLSRQAFLSVTPVNDVPVLGGISGTIGYTLGSAAVIVASAATLTDVDSANFDTGELRVRITDGASVANQLELSGFTIGPGNAVMQGTTQVGTRTSDGLNGNELRITLNANATKTIVQQLVRSVTFRATSTTGSRTLLFSVSDGDGDTSLEVSKAVNVT